MKLQYQLESTAVAAASRLLNFTGGDRRKIENCVKFWYFTHLSGTPWHYCPYSWATHICNAHPRIATWHRWEISLHEAVLAVPHIWLCTFWNAFDLSRSLCHPAHANVPIFLGPNQARYKTRPFDLQWPHKEDGRARAKVGVAWETMFHIHPWMNANDLCMWNQRKVPSWSRLFHHPLHITGRLF